MTSQPPPIPAARHAHRRQAVRRQAQGLHWHFYKARADWSFIPNFARAPIRWRGEHHVLLGLSAALLFLAFVVLPSWAEAARPLGHGGVPLVAEDIALPEAPAATFSTPVPAIEDEWTAIEVKKGQTMGQIFSTLGFSNAVLHNIVSTSPHGQSLTRIRPGQRFEFQRDATGALIGLRFDADERQRVVLHLGDEGPREEVISRAFEHRVSRASGTVDSSLFASGEAAGLSDAMIMQMAEVFAYDIDFAQDLRRGDQFSVVYEQLYQDGEPVRSGNILAASFVNDGRRFTALRFTLPDGRVDYFDEDGRSLRKAFLRTPVAFTRISSGFSSARMHPILGRMRAHQGVDYATPAGTPIRAAGDGKIGYRGWKTGYGNVIIVEHTGGRFSTLYGHMSRFDSAFRVGSRVRQGDVIGYVGMTGLATAPHLHYEFRERGVHRDPLKVDLPKAEPLTGAALAGFRRESQSLRGQLALLEGHGPDAVATR